LKSKSTISWSLAQNGALKFLEFECMKNKEKVTSPRECTNVVVFLEGNEDHTIRQVQPPQEDADEGLGEKYPGIECTDIAVLLTEEDSLSPPSDHANHSRGE
jgi:hypothetical protein